VVAAIGVDVLRHRDGRSTHNAVCALPLILGAHQFVEAFVWLGLEHRVDPGAGRFAMWIYLAIAFVVLPIFVPAAVFLLEPNQRRRRLMVPFEVLGIAVAADLLAAMVRGPVGVKLRPYHLAYSVHLSDGGLVVVLYVVAVCGAFLLSSYRPIAAYGVVNLIAVAIIAKLTVDGFASVWCGYAALTSVALAIYMRRTLAKAPRAPMVDEHLASPQVARGT
jgi:hypothetical protein